MKDALVNSAVGALVFIFSAYYLYQNYFGGRFRLTFRAGCYTWLALLISITMVCSGVTAVAELIWNNL